MASSKCFTGGTATCLCCPSIKAWTARDPSVMITSSAAADNLAKRNGYPTTAELSPDRPTTVRYIQGVSEVPAGFDRVADIDIGETEIELRAVSGDRVSVPVRSGFVFDGQA